MNPVETNAMREKASTEDRLAQWMLVRDRRELKRMRATYGFLFWRLRWDGLLTRLYDFFTN